MLLLDNPFLIALLALAFDFAVGDPPGIYDRLAHPVALVGRLVEFAERRLNRASLRAHARFARGLLLTVAVTSAAAAVGFAAEWMCMRLPFGEMLEAIFASTLIAFRGLYLHVNAVAVALERGLDDARDAVKHIVGRDPHSLDEAGVARAAIESAAENFSDGVVAPLFWFVLFGLPGLCAYKAINTLDSMLGHRSDRFLHFGKSAARVDDAVNWIPARLAGLLLVAASALVPGANARAAWRTMYRDARKHRSVNAGWQEAAVAGAFGYALAGPRRYPGHAVEDAWIGDGRRLLSADDVHATLRLYITAGGLLAVGLLAASLVWS